MNVSRIHRLLRLITILQSGRGLSVDELASELEVSRRTVFRDLNMLELAHIPYYYDKDRGSYRINNHFFLPPVNLTLSEALAIMLKCRGRSTTQLPWGANAAKAAMKLQSALPPAVREHIGDILDHVQIRQAPTARHEGLDKVLDQLTEAVSMRRVCRMVYISFHERKQLRLNVHPLRLVFVQRAWYLLAHSQMHEEIRTFKIGRIKKLEMLNKTFLPPENREVDKHFGNAWSMIPEGTCYDIHLHFSKQVAGNVAEVQWHSSQIVEWNDDGSMEFRVCVDGLNEIMWWILGYGDQVRVVSPRALSDKVRAVAEQMVSSYSESGV